MGTRGRAWRGVSGNGWEWGAEGREEKEPRGEEGGGGEEPGKEEGAGALLVGGKLRMIQYRCSV